MKHNFDYTMNIKLWIISVYLLKLNFPNTLQKLLNFSCNADISIWVWSKVMFCDDVQIMIYHKLLFNVFHTIVIILCNSFQNPQ